MKYLVLCSLLILTIQFGLHEELLVSTILKHGSRIKKTDLLRLKATCQSHYISKKSKPLKVRQTNYVNSYGYVTQQEQQGEGIFDTLLKGATSTVTSDKTKEVIAEGAKAVAKSAERRRFRKIHERKI